MYQLTSADILAKARIWAGSSEEARNEEFHITNGDYFRWRHRWHGSVAVIGTSLNENTVIEKYSSYPNLLSVAGPNDCSAAVPMDPAALVDDLFRAIE